MNQKKRVVGYSRTVARPESEPEQTLYRLEKWEALDRALEEDAEALVIAFPEVLGDNYTEIIVNLGKVSASGKELAVIKPSPFMHVAGFIDVPKEELSE